MIDSLFAWPLDGRGLAELHLARILSDLVASLPNLSAFRFSHVVSPWVSSIIHAEYNTRSGVARQQTACAYGAAFGELVCTVFCVVVAGLEPPQIAHDVTRLSASSIARTWFPFAPQYPQYAAGTLMSQDFMHCHIASNSGVSSISGVGSGHSMVRLYDDCTVMQSLVPQSFADAAQAMANVTPPRAMKTPAAATNQSAGTIAPHRVSPAQSKMIERAYPSAADHHGMFE